MKDDAIMVAGIAIALLGIFFYAKGAIGDAFNSVGTAISNGLSNAGTAVVGNSMAPFNTQTPDQTSSEQTLASLDALGRAGL